MTSRESNEIDYSEFLSDFKAIVASMCDDLKTVGPVELRIESIWMNLYNANSWQEIHNHSTHNNNISFVYFVNLIPQTDGEFFFLNERSQFYSASGLHDVLRLAETVNMN